MAKKMTGGKAAKMGFASKSTGGKDDGSRKSKKAQTTALIPQNKMGSARKGRIAKMEKSDAPA